jgi:hypothetical protein
MSAFFVSREVIHDTVQAWIIAHPQPRSADVLNGIGRSLWRMNAEALRQRYNLDGTEELAEYLGAAEAYVFFPPKVSAAQLAKSAHCLRYQSCEGNVPETSDTYQELNRIVDAMGKPAGYDDAQWDRCAA